MPDDELELRSVSPAAVPRAVEKAEHYRLLGQPAEAESICRDVLSTQPDHDHAMVVLVLALTDQFGDAGGGRGAKEAADIASALPDEYRRSYYSGIVRERRARALLRQGPSRGFAYSGLREAMDWYDKASTLSSDDDEAILRWNSCLRTIREHKLEPPEAEIEQPLE